MAQEPGGPGEQDNQTWAFEDTEPQISLSPARRKLPLGILISSIILLGSLLGAITWGILDHSSPGGQRGSSSSATPSSSTATSGAQTNAPVSPLLFGTNL